MRPLPLVALLLLSLLLQACQEPVDLREESDEAREQGFIDELVAQNTALREENEELRWLLMEHEATLCTLNESFERCASDLASWQSLREQRSSPADRLAVSDVVVRGDTVLLNLSGAMLVLPSGTGSMEPVAGEDATILVISPSTPREIHIGDIIGYECAPCGGNQVMHRVAAIGKDEKGLYYVTKGDNNPTPDPYRVRFEDVRTLVVGIIY